MDGISACRTLRTSSIHHFLLVQKGHGSLCPLFGENMQCFRNNTFTAFAENDAPVTLTHSQKILLEKWSKLNKEQQDILFELIDKMNC